MNELRHAAADLTRWMFGLRCCPENIFSLLYYGDFNNRDSLHALTPGNRRPPSFYSHQLHCGNPSDNPLLQLRVKRHVTRSRLRQASQHHPAASTISEFHSDCKEHY